MVFVLGLNLFLHLVRKTMRSKHKFKCKNFYICQVSKVQVEKALNKYQTRLGYTDVNLYIEAFIKQVYRLFT